MPLLAAWETDDLSTLTEAVVGDPPSSPKVARWRDTQRGLFLRQSSEPLRPVLVRDPAGVPCLLFTGTERLELALPPFMQQRLAGALSVVVVCSIDAIGQEENLLSFSSTVTPAQFRLTAIPGLGLGLTLRANDGITQSTVRAGATPRRAKRVYAGAEDNAGTVLLRRDFESPIVDATAVTFQVGDLDTLIIGADGISPTGISGRVYGVYLYSETLAVERASRVAARAESLFSISANEVNKIPRIRGVAKLEWNADVGLGGITLNVSEWSTTTNGGSYVEQTSPAQRPSTLTSITLGRVMVFDKSNQEFMFEPPLSVPLVDWANVQADDLSLTFVGTLLPDGSLQDVMRMQTANGAVRMRVTVGGNLELEATGQSGTQTLVVPQIPSGRPVAVFARFGANATVWVNGVRFVQAPGGPLGALGAKVELTIGSGIGGLINFFDGNIKQLAILPYAMTDDEMAAAVESGEDLFGVPVGVEAWAAVNIDSTRDVVGNPVDLWGNVAQPGGTLSAIATARPLVGSQNGLPAVTFDGVDDTMAGTSQMANALDGASSPTVFAVVKLDTLVGGTRRIFQADGPGNFRLSMSRAGALWRMQGQDGGVVLQSLTGGSPTTDRTLLDGRFGNPGQLRQDGVQVASGNVPLAAMNFAALSVGSTVAATEHFPGPICELAILPYTASDALRAAIFNFLRNKWGTP